MQIFVTTTHDIIRCVRELDSIQQAQTLASIIEFFEDALFQEKGVAHVRVSAKTQNWSRLRHCDFGDNRDALDMDDCRVRGGGVYIPVPAVARPSVLILSCNGQVAAFSCLVTTGFLFCGPQVLDKTGRIYDPRQVDACRTIDHTDVRMVQTGAGKEHMAQQAILQELYLLSLHNSKLVVVSKDSQAEYQRRLPMTSM